MKKAIVLCSGGLDSVVTAQYVKKRLNYDKIIVLFFDYGQKSLIAERRSAKYCTKELGADFIEIKIKELGKMSGSLINKSGKVRGLKRKDLKGTSEESKKWYVPCRNLVFLSYALALADGLYVKNKERCDIFVGFKNEGADGYPDTSKFFVKKMNNIAESSCSGKFKILAPLINKDKEDIIKLGTNLGADLGKTFSCYVANRTHCGECLACMLRKEGFYWSGVKDPTFYVKR